MMPIGRLTAFLVFAVAMTKAASAIAAPIANFDGPVAIGPTQAPGVWYTDRYPPAGFAGGQVAPDGRTGTLRHSISEADFNRAAPFNTPFYNTQGRKFDTGPGLTSAFIEMYVPGAWDALAQDVTGAEGRLASFWATGFNAANTTDANTKFAIIEFNNDAGAGSLNSFRVWDDDVGGFVNVGGFNGFGQWYELGFVINGTELEYYVNGALVYTDTSIGSTTQFGNLILQGYNAGNSYDIYWDNLQTTSSVPEPASLALWSLIGVAGLAYRRRRKQQIEQTMAA